MAQFLDCLDTTKAIHLLSNSGWSVSREKPGKDQVMCPWPAMDKLKLYTVTFFMSPLIGFGGLSG